MQEQLVRLLCIISKATRTRKLVNERQWMRSGGEIVKFGFYADRKSCRRVQKQAELKTKAKKRCCYRSWGWKKVNLQFACLFPARHSENNQIEINLRFLWRTFRFYRENTKCVAEWRKVGLEAFYGFTISSWRTTKKSCWYSLSLTPAVSSIHCHRSLPFGGVHEEVTENCVKF